MNELSYGSENHRHPHQNLLSSTLFTNVLFDHLQILQTFHRYGGV